MIITLSVDSKLINLVEIIVKFILTKYESITTAAAGYEQTHVNL